jgi:hypothetical protein
LCRPPPGGAGAYFLRGATEIASATLTADVAGSAGDAGESAGTFFGFFCSLLPR